MSFLIAQLGESICVYHMHMCIWCVHMCACMYIRIVSSDQHKYNHMYVLLVPGPVPAYIGYPSHTDLVFEIVYFHSFSYFSDYKTICERKPTLIQMYQHVYPSTMQRVLSPTRCTMEALKGHRVWKKSKSAISSGWLKKKSVSHPDDIITLP